MSDRRYSTARWQRLRKAVLAHYGHVCQIQGPSCTGVANTVHHILPSSQYPELFWEPTNLEASCAPCNYSGGARVAAENKRGTIARLQELVEQQDQEIARLLERLARYESAESQSLRRRTPAIR